MSLDHLVPGISKYPDLEARLRTRLAEKQGGGKCCNRNPVIADFRSALQRRIERDKSTPPQ